MTLPGIVLTPRDGPPWRFDTGALFLEFLLTGGPDDLSVFDRLHEPGDLRRWIDACRLDLSGTDVTVSPADIGPARDLRDALWRATRATVARAEVRAVDRESVNRAAAAPPLAAVWTADGPQWQTPDDCSAVLATVARDAIDVLAGAGKDRVRECAADDCRLVFLDTSRPGGRRWCSMQRCGNRHKVRQHRTRTQEVTGGSE